MKKKFKNLGWVGLSVIVVSSTAYFSTVIYKILSSNNEETEDTYPVNASKRYIDDDYGFSMKEFYNDAPYLGEEGIKLLHEKIKNEMGYGPEIAGINRIYITDGYFIDRNANGVFYPATKEIFLNTRVLRQTIPIDAPMAIKVELAYQIVFHEYGHYISSVYLTNNKPSESYIANIYSTSANDSRNQQNWNKNFVEKFKSNLNYDKDTPLYQNGSFSDYKALGSIYNAKEIFDISNGKEKPEFKNLGNASYTGKLGTIGFYNNQYWYFKQRKLSLDNLEYYYSMDELYTRKYQLLRMVVPQKDYGDGFKMTDSGLFIEPYQGRTLVFPTPYLEDVSKIQAGMRKPKNNNESQNFKRENFRTLEDSPYGMNENGDSLPGNSKKMYNDMVEEMGQKDGSDISFMISKNTSTVSSNNKYIPGGDANLIKFGGYLTPEEAKKYKLIGYLENGTFHGYEIKTSEFSYKYKNSFVSQTEISTEYPENFFYTTKDFIDATKINNKKLYFASTQDGNITNVTPLKSVRGGELGRTSNYFPRAPQQIQSAYYEAVNDNGIVKISRGTWN
ncbi:MAG: hypothetical protein HRT99_00180 [Mycoplasmatales bacterium]|nr:hypothetical protein [Mycoplasmatales bacterium]